MTGSLRIVPRIPPVTDPDDAQQAILAKAPTREDGTVRNLFLTFAQHPMLLKRFNAFAGTFFISGKLTDHERELLVLRAASHAGSRYEYAQHLSIARDAGMSDDLILAAMRQPGAPDPAPEDQLLLDATDELLTDGHIGDATWAGLAERFDDDALLEVVFVIGFYRMTGDVLNTIGVEVEEEPDLAIDWRSEC